MIIEAGYPAEAADPYCLREGEAARLLAGHPWRRFAVLGDSIAEGVGDPTPGYSELPWADRIAAELRARQPDLAYLNLGLRFTRAAVVRADQLAAALAFEPDLALVACGGYDLLQPDYDPAAVDEQLRAIVAALRERGTVVITTGMFDGSLNPKVPEALRPEFSRRLHTLSDLTGKLAVDLGTVHVNLTNHPASKCTDIYSRDGRHGSGRGHAISAAEAIRQLGARLAANQAPAPTTAATAASAALAALSTPDGAANPYPHYAALRAVSPVWVPAKGSIFLTGYRECQHVIRDTDSGFHAQNADWMDNVRPNWRDHPGLVATTDSFLFKDPPEHTRLRRLVAGAFTQHQAATLRAHIAGLTDRVLDRIAEAGSDGGPVDLHEILAATLPISVVGHVLGVPEEDHAILREPLEGLRLSVDGGNRAANLDLIDRGGTALVEYFAALAARRREDPREDVVTALTVAAGRDALTEDEIQQTLTLIFSAGIESMVDMLLNGLAALLDHPEQVERLRDDARLWPGAVEEMMRYDTPVQAMGRVSGKDTVVGGVPVPAGRLVIIMLGAAHRDPAAFPDPDIFDITRSARAEPAVLSFGGGVHHCLGAPLARMQASVFLPALLARFPGLHRAGPLVRRGFVLRGFADFPVGLR